MNDRLREAAEDVIQYAVNVSLPERLDNALRDLREALASPERVDGLREWVTEVRAKFRLPTETGLDPSRSAAAQVPARDAYWIGYAAAVKDVERLAATGEVANSDPSPMTERAAVAGKTAQAVDREGGATTPARAQDSADHVHPGGFTGQHQHSGWHRHPVTGEVANSDNEPPPLDVERERAWALVMAVMEQMRRDRGWPTPSHMRRAADGLDILSIPRYGDILRWVADLRDASLEAAGEDSK